MPSLHCNPGPHAWSGPYGGNFRPQGPIIQAGPRPNPPTWSSNRTQAARLIVGFSVGQEPRWTLDDLIPIVRRIREEVGGSPNASFIAQKGIYQHHDPDKGVVTEDGAQVLIINESSIDDDAFTAQMIAMAEQICRELEQESVSVEIQVNGMTQTTMGVTA